MDKNRKQDRSRNHYNKRNKNKRKKKERKMKASSKRCPHCSNEMRCRGASNSMGGISWKCRNNKCGRTIWQKKQIVVPPEPVVSQSYMDRII